MSTSTGPGPVGEAKMLHGKVVKDSEKYCGAGSFGEVFRGTWTNPASVTVRVAIKVLRGADLVDEMEKVEQRLKRESIVWSKLEHKNVLPFLGLCGDFGPSLALISPYCEFGHVMEYLRKHPTVDKLAIVKGVAYGLLYLHTEEVIHGDMKGTNILVDARGVPQICDFGRSKIIDQRGYTTAFHGTHRYSAPELAEESDTVPELSKSTDVYSFAMVTFEIITGAKPFPRLNEQQVIVAVNRGTRPKHEGCNSLAADHQLWILLGKWWAQEPKDRPDMQEVVSALGHI